jgi:hypothetical protein
MIVSKIFGINVSPTHVKLALLFNQCILEPQQVPDFFTKGITYLKPKDENTKNPSNYHPITCLPMIYKMLTSIISDKLSSHLKTNNIIAEEQVLQLQYRIRLLTQKIT